MSEERISNLAELYDRTKRCTGVSIPKRCLVIIDICTGDLQDTEHRRGVMGYYTYLVNGFGIILKELMVAGVGELYINVVGKFRENEHSPEFASFLERYVDFYRDSVRPSTVIKYKYDDNNRNTPRYLGEFDSAIIIHGNERKFIDEDIMSSFTAKKAILTFVTESEDRHDVLLSSEIFAWKQSSPAGEVKYIPHKTGVIVPFFNMNSRVATQIIYMLCSEELGEVCFKEKPQQYLALEIDGKFFQNIFEKLSMQGLANDFDKRKPEDFSRLIYKMRDYEDNHNSEFDRRLNSRSTNFTAQRERWFGNNWIEANTDVWSTDDYIELSNAEARLAGSVNPVPIPVVGDGANGDEPEEAIF